MNKRLRKASRLLSVQEDLHRIAEWKLARLQHQAEELRQAQESLIQALNDDEALYGLFVEARAKQLQALSGQAGKVREAQEAQEKMVLDRAIQVKRAERRVDALSIEHKRYVEKKDYLALLDNLVSKPDASLP